MSQTRGRGPNLPGTPGANAPRGTPPEATGSEKGGPRLARGCTGDRPGHRRPGQEAHRRNPCPPAPSGHRWAHPHFRAAEKRAAGQLSAGRHGDASARQRGAPHAWAGPGVCRANPMPGMNRGLLTYGPWGARGDTRPKASKLKGATCTPGGRVQTLQSRRHRGGPPGPGWAAWRLQARPPRPAGAMARPGASLLGGRREQAPQADRRTSGQREQPLWSGSVDPQRQGLHLS